MFLSDTPEREEFARSLRGICSSHFADEGEEHRRDWDPVLWRRLGDAGVWGLLAGGGGTVSDVACAAEALGAEGLAGPIAATYLATTVLPEADLDDIASGAIVVGVADDDPVVPWAQVADVLLHVDGDVVCRASPSSAVEPVATLAREPWGRLAVVAGDVLPHGSRGLAVADVALAAYLIGATEVMLHGAVSYTRDRVQFDRPLFSFQSVAHRLAAASSELHVAGNLVAWAAAWLDEPEIDAEIAFAAAAASRLRAAEVALSTGFTAHQVYGGMGFVAGTMLAVLSHRVQQAVLLPPAPRLLEKRVLSLPGVFDRRTPE